VHPAQLAAELFQGMTTSDYVFAATLDRLAFLFQLGQRPVLLSRQPLSLCFAFILNLTTHFSQLLLEFLRFCLGVGQMSFGFSQLLLSFILPRPLLVPVLPVLDVLAVRLPVQSGVGSRQAVEAYVQLAVLLVEFLVAAIQFGLAFAQP
jgi:hypothetical protein